MSKRKKFKSISSISHTYLLSSRNPNLTFYPPKAIKRRIDRKDSLTPIINTESGVINRRGNLNFLTLLCLFMMFPGAKANSRSHKSDVFIDDSKAIFSIPDSFCLEERNCFTLDLIRALSNENDSLAEPHKNKKFDILAPKPIEYFGGVMDEETRPLLKPYIESLDENEGALVVFRLEEGMNPDYLLESSIQEISGHDWDVVSYGKKSDSPMQVLVDKLAETAMSLRMPNVMFSQGSAKIKATDTHKIVFGVVGKHKDVPVTTIKGIVHQQLNMGYNGDLLLHEFKIILSSLMVHGVLNDELLRSRPLRFKTYGAGGSSSEDTNPGDMRVSDGVIDIRSHIDPLYFIEYFDWYLQSITKDQHEKLDSKKFDAYQRQVDLIKSKLGYREDILFCGLLAHEIGNKDYTGIEMTIDIAKLGKKIAKYIEVPIDKILKQMNTKKKRYYGEITFSTVNTGISTIYRVDRDENNLPFLGDKGQQKLMETLEKFFIQMSYVNKKSSKRFYELRLEYFDREIKKQEDMINEITKKVFFMLRESLSEEEKKQILTLQEKIDAIRKDVIDFADDLILPPDMPSHKKKTVACILKTLKDKEEKFQNLRDAQIEIINSLKLKENMDPFILDYVRRKHYKLGSLESKFKFFINELILSKIKNLSFIRADIKLRKHIKHAKEVYSAFFPDQVFGITASGNMFFSHLAKDAVGQYGSKTVEMENQLFSQIVHHCILNKILIEEELITKIAADPLKIESDISDELNTWAEQHTMTVEDYVSAFMWAYHGQSFINFPDNGRWEIAEKLYKEKPRNKLRFYNFGTEEVPKIMNPFWKEIGTDLVKEIFDGKAFLGSAFDSMNFNVSPLAQEKKHLQELAKEIMENYGPIESQVRKLFSSYLQLMQPLHIPGVVNQYRVYARKTAILQAGYVEGNIVDWDQPIYKSTNTAVLAKSATFFVDARRGKAIGGGKSLIALESP